MGWIFCCCLACVNQSTVAILQQWGRFVRILQPGLSCFNPFFGEWVVGELSLRLKSLDVKCETKTKDNVFVNLHCAIQFRVVPLNADDAFYKLQDPTAQIQSYVFDVIRACIPKLTLDEVFEQKSQVAKEVLEELEKVMEGYGYQIEQILIVDIVPDDHVRHAMNEINAAQRSKVAAEYKGEAEKIQQVKRAEADSESKYLSGIGIARQRQAITDGLKESVLAFSDKVPGASPKEVMDMVLITQYFDTMKEIGSSSKNSAIFLPHGPGHLSDISQQIQAGIVQGNTSSSLMDLATGPFVDGGESSFH